jgi:hypothetical protein
MIRTWLEPLYNISAESPGIADSIYVKRMTIKKL